MWHFFRQVCFFLAATGIGLFFCVHQATADPIVLTFDELKDGEEIGNFYNGGFGSDGSGPGPTLGVVFTNIGTFNTVAALDCYVGCNEPSGPNSLDLFAQTTINVSGGFSTAFSFFYADPLNTNFTNMSISIFEGLDRTGALLMSVNLPDTGQSFVAFSVQFSGIARSVAITTGPNTVFFDNMTFGEPIPEPATIILLTTAFFSLAVKRGHTRRRQR